MLTIEWKSYHVLSTKSNLFQARVCFLSVLRATPKHIPLKRGCPYKKCNRIRVVYLNNVSNYRIEVTLYVHHVAQNPYLFELVLIINRCMHPHSMSSWTHGFRRKEATSGRPTACLCDSSLALHTWPSPPSAGAFSLSLETSLPSPVHWRFFPLSLGWSTTCTSR